MKPKRPPLSPLELEVMSLVWDLGETTSIEIVDAFTKRRPPDGYVEMKGTSSEAHVR